MGVALRQVSPAAEEIFHLADHISGLPIGDLCARGPLTDLTRTSVAQMAVVATSLAAAAYLRELVGDHPEIIAVAGHSVGELTAMCWAGCFDLPTTLRLVNQRGRLMERESSTIDGTMVAIVGMGREELESICAEVSGGSDGQAQVANLNAPGQVVLSGARRAVAAAAERALATGARRAIPLAVSGPFHSAYMHGPAQEFERFVSAISIDEPRVPIVLNTTARPSRDVAVLRSELSRQIERPVLWDDSLRTLHSMGCSVFVELGPGSVLAGLVRRTLPEAIAIAAGNPEAINTLANELPTAHRGSEHSTPTNSGSRPRDESGP